MARVIYRNDPTIPASDGVTVTPDDNAELAVATRSVYIGNAGNLHITFQDGGDVILVNLPVGWHPISVKKIWSTGTSANNIVAVW